MTHSSLFRTFCLAALILSGRPDSCPYSERSWRGLTQPEQESLLRKPRIETVDSSCFRLLVNRYVADLRLRGKSPTGAFELLRAFTGKTGGRVPTHVLLCAVQTGIAQEKPDVFRDLVSDWEKSNGRLRDRIRHHQQDGRTELTDSLYMVLEACASLQAFEYMQWARIKQVLRRHNDAALRLCRASTTDARITSVARSQLLRMLDEGDSLDIAGVLRSYEECILSRPETDSAAFRDWLAQAYCRYDLYGEATRLLTTLEQSDSPSHGQLLGMAQKLFSRRRFAEAVAPAILAFQRFDSERLKSLSAVIVYQAYAEQGKRDSALVWLNRAGLAEADRLRDAIVLCQSANLLDRADSMLTRLPQSITRDTLQLRQYLLLRQWENAGEHASGLTTSKAWKKNVREARLWLMRTKLFSGDAAAAKAQVDSMPFSPSWENAEEVLSFRYFFQKLSRFPGAFVRWGRVEHALYAGISPEVVEMVNWEKFSDEATLFLATRLSRGLLREARYAEAIVVLEGIPPTRAFPEQRFLLGEVFLRHGLMDRGRAVLEDLILKHPQDVFSSKARVLLNSLDRT